MTTKKLGATTGTCAACGERAQLDIVETRRRRRLSDRLDRSFSDALLRTATCRTCVTTYPIRATDLTTDGAARRRTRSLGRDWDYTRVA